MVVPNEEIFCAIRTSNSDIILTSNRLIIQSLPFSVSLVQFILHGLFLFLPPQEALFGSGRYVAWEGDKIVSGGGSLKPPKNRQKVVAPDRIVYNIPYDEIMEMEIESGVSGFTGNIRTEKYSLPFGLDKDRFAIFWHFIPAGLKDKINFPNKKEMSKLKNVFD